jgi:hypothetical protein
VTASLEAGDVPAAPADGVLAAAKRAAIDPTGRFRYLSEIWNHRAAEARRRAAPAAARTADALPGSVAVTEDRGEIAVIQDEGDLVLPPNVFDLRDAGLQFTPNGAGGYDVRRIDAAFRPTLGNRLTLGDDDSVQVDVPFGFPFYGRAQRTAFVNSDGNVTFESEDRASTERDLSRLLTGPPRVAPFLADLDPSTGGGGRIFAHAAADQYTVTWCDVLGFESQRSARVQVTLLPGGTIEMKFGSSITLTDAIVGVSPGLTGGFAPVDLSAQGPSGGGSAAVGERFAERGQLDTVALGRKFYQTHADIYDQILIWTDVTLTRNAFAFEITIANDVRGIGLPLFNSSNDFGSAGRLQSVVMMDWLAKYPADPNQTFLGENNTLSVLGQEVGHRWLAYFEFRDAGGQRSDALLGRDSAHWSFFLDSDASVMEGNDIQDLGGGSFRTVGAVRRYSLLDQYAMGLIGPNEVPPFFYVENPVNSVPAKDRASGPDLDVTFNGTRRDVLLQDVIAIHGDREPAAAQSARVQRQAFIFVVSNGRSTNDADISKLDNIRRLWEAFFLQATDNRMRAETRLRPPS